MSENTNCIDIDEVYCLTASLTDKEIVSKYKIGIATIRIWKNRGEYDMDLWRRITYELLIRYIEDKDNYRNNSKIPNSDIKKNITTLEFGERYYDTFRNSTKPYKSFLVELIERTPPEVFKVRIDFIKECISSRDLNKTEEE